MATRNQVLRAARAAGVKKVGGNGVEPWARPSANSQRRKALVDMKNQISAMQNTINSSAFEGLPSANRIAQALNATMSAIQNALMSTPSDSENR